MCAGRAGLCSALCCVYPCAGLCLLQVSSAQVCCRSSKVWAVQREDQQSSSASAQRFPHGECRLPWLAVSSTCVAVEGLSCPLGW